VSVDSGQIVFWEMNLAQQKPIREAFKAEHIHVQFRVLRETQALLVMEISRHKQKVLLVSNVNRKEAM